MSTASREDLEKWERIQAGEDVSFGTHTDTTAFYARMAYHWKQEAEAARDDNETADRLLKKWKERISNLLVHEYALEAALRKHGRHIHDCPAFGYLEPRKCTCGLRRALTEENPKGR